MYIGPTYLVLALNFIAAVTFAGLLEFVERRWRWVSSKPQLFVALGDGLLLIFVSVLVGREHWWQPWVVFIIGGLPTYIRSEWHDHQRGLRTEEHLGR